MFGRFVVGLVLVSVIVNVTMIVLVVISTVARELTRTATDKLRPNPFRFRHPALEKPPSGWVQVIPHLLLALVAAVFTNAFVGGEMVEHPLPYYGLGFMAVLISQTSNLRTKMAQMRSGGELALAAAAALPWALMVAPAAWIAYLVVVIAVSPGDVNVFDTAGEALTAAALALGDWLVVRIAAIGLLLLFGLQFLMVLPALLLASVTTFNRSRPAAK